MSGIMLYKHKLHYQSTLQKQHKFYKEKFLYSDKNCQEIKRPKKPKSIMQPMTKEENVDVQLPKQARLCRDMNCQSTRCYKQMSPR